ncbi:hypothetical protein AB4Y42_34590 [Paraburkholderia sp. EG286B]|uniref:hypothetical protein n=1 Tax=Paraburkholderia sp. EG286B TaxID=3237011 RepID=UPI0034D2D19E
MKTMISRLMAARDWREKLRKQPFTNAEFARGLHVKQASVNYWKERGEGDLKTETVFHAANFLGINERWLATGEGVMSSEGWHPNVQYPYPPSRLVLQLENSEERMPPALVKVLRTIVDAHEKGVPPEFFEALTSIVTLLATKFDASIVSSQETEMGQSATQLTASRTAEAKFAEEERETEAHLASRGEGSGAARRTRGRKSKSA